MKPLKLHIKTTIVVSIVLMAVLGVVAYFSDLAITGLNNQQQQQEAVLLAARVADVVELHIEREQRTGKIGTSKASGPQVKASLDWMDIEEAINNTIVNRYPELTAVRVLQDSGSSAWTEVIRIPTNYTAGLVTDAAIAREHPSEPRLGPIEEVGTKRLVVALAPVKTERRNSTPVQVGEVRVLLSFDKHGSSAAALRSLIWPLMVLAILAITFINYFLFRHIVYNPIDNLLGAMSKAEEGNLSVVVEQLTPDEIGLLSARFNRMLGRIRRITEELANEQRQLESRVQEATGEIADRKQQLEEANLRLFEMQRQLTQLERLAAAGQLAAQFAHEVGTPLNLISGHVQLLRARAAEERTIKRLDIIAGQIERITHIVKSMLDSTRRPALRLAATDVNDLLVRILDASQPTLTAHNVELVTDLARDLPSIQADPDQLQQVFINLINNSLDAMDEGGRLSVRTIRDRESVVIGVADTGEGIPEDRIGVIFDPLFSTKAGRGTGLGLTIVKQIVAEHGGAVEVESEQGKGTTFAITLPIANSLAASPHEPKTEVQKSAARPGLERLEVKR